MNKYGFLIRERRIAEIEMIALDTLELILMEDRTNAKSIELFVRIFYKTRVDFLAKNTPRQGMYTRARRLYMFLRYVFCEINIQAVADEMGCSRANVYHHCELVFSDYKHDPSFFDKISPVLDKETMKILKDKHDDKKW